MKCIASLTAALHEHAQLIAAAGVGQAADVDRLIKGGANTEAKDAVRAQCQCPCWGSRLFPL